MAGLDLGAIAQLGERYTGSVEVGGSIPPGSTNLTKRGRKFMRPFLCPEIIEPLTVSASRVRVQSIPTDFIPLKRTHLGRPFCSRNTGRVLCRSEVTRAFSGSGDHSAAT